MKNPDNERTIQGKSEIGEPKRQQKEADPKGGGETLKSKSSEKETPGQVTSEIGHFRKISEAKFVTKKETSEQKRVEDKTIAPNSNEAKNCVNRGVAFLQKKQFEEAAQEFTKAINLDPNYKVPYYNRGLVFYSRGEYDRAIKDFSAALTLNPNDSDSYYNRGLCYNLERQTDKAKQDFQTACDLGDKDGCKKSGR